MNPAGFEGRVRGELTLAPLQEPLTAGSIVAGPSATRYLILLEQKREISSVTVDAEPFLKDAKIGDADVKSFYDQNNAAFVTPEQVRFEYAILSPDALARNVAVDAAEVRKHYDDHLATYTTPEERSAAHILIAVAKDAKDDAKAAARRKADEIAAQVRAQPARFAEIAKAQSQDPGSAPQGGDLGGFGRGSMVKPFEDAVFSARPGEIVGPIETDFGWHVIRVNGVRASTQRTFDQVKSEIETDLKRQRAQQKFAAAADQFQNLVYEQADSLAGVGKALDVPVQTSALVTRSQVQQIAMGNAKFAEALFSPTSLQAKRNTDAIEIAANTLMAGRVVEHKPSAPRSFDEVRDEIRRQLERKAASGAAERAGRAKLALLEQGRSDKEAGLAFGKPIEVARNQAGAGLPPDALQRIFQVDAGKLPGYVSAPNPRGGFTIYRVTRVIDPPSLDPARLKLAADRMGDQIGREFANAYVAALRGRADVKIRQAELEKK
jgi:peptidyl-prolyl cis-trans isomerase D